MSEGFPVAIDIFVGDIDVDLEHITAPLPLEPPAGYRLERDADAAAPEGAWCVRGDGRRLWIARRLRAPAWGLL